ncbi:sugar-binding domain-containing protein [Rufibacter sediminis]|uniref:Glycoside hydrolase family 2 protein n=1 Tax=Rufibacter sediminis TaxID=2762756 RepID=A0ABR6VPN5_9BACT|nr:sugar-binding domain-containing protein [Rufibacter sediminis]MBC3539143.1 glycoside hydrolase family 2 protein [Rufibacter sediminis]
MKNRFLLFLLTTLLISYAQPGVAQQARTKALFNDNWKFYKGDAANAEKADFADANWRSLDLPHDWSIEGPFSQEWASATGYLPGGIGWYRKTFTVAPEQQNKKLFLYFDGVYKNSEVWINGHHLGKRPNGFTPFQYEITNYLNKTGKNVVSVKVDHRQFADSRWYTGSGINRNVYLVAVQPVHVSLWGVAFTTPEVSAASALSQVTVSVTNTSPKAVEVQVKTELLDKQGKVVNQAQKQVNVGQGKEAEAALSFQVKNPKLWSVEQPNLYQLRVSLLVNGKKTDEVTESVGFRSFAFDANKGFSLNGKSMKLKGVCIHDDAGALGTAVPEEVWERRLITLKEGGVNSLRMSHNPHADYIYDLCDKLGFLVQDEAFDEWETGKNKWIAGWNVGTPGKDGYHEHFKEWADRDLADMILRNRNRPSIFMWSIGNEIDYPNDPYSHEVLNTGNNPQIYGKGYQPNNPPASRLSELSRHLVEVAKKYDTSRPITAALAGVVMSNFTDYPKVLDIVGYNYQEHRYPEDHAKYPDRVIYGSENGMRLNAWAAVDTNAYISAQYLWTGIDYMGEAGKWPSRSNGAGLLDLAGFKKPEYFFRQSLWSDKPMVYIGTSAVPKTEDKGIWSHRRADPTWNWKANDSVRVSCFTNADEAELFLNGKSLGRKSLAQSAQRVLYWDMVYAPGELMAKAYKNGKEVSRHELITAGAPVAIKANLDKKALARKGVAHVEINVVDKNGNLVYGADNEMTVTIEGPAQLLGMENGSHTAHENYKSEKRKVLHGKLLAYLQATQKPGKVKVTIQSPGLTPQIVELSVKQAQNGMSGGAGSASVK